MHHFCQGTHFFFKTVGGGAMWGGLWVERWNLLIEIFLNDIFSPSSNVIHTKELLLNYVPFLGIQPDLSAIWGFYADSKSSLVVLFHSTSFTGPLAQSAGAENQVSPVKYTDIPKISITASFPSLFSQFLCYERFRAWTRLVMLTT